MGPDFLVQLFLFQEGAHLVTTLIQNSESVWISHSSSLAYSMAFIKAMPSMRMLVESFSLPMRTGLRSSPICSIPAQPPGPGFGSALPSVHKIFIILL